MNTSLRIGTAGWSYPHWNGVVYPKTRAGGFHPIEYLSKQIDAIEINSSFYQPLKPEIVTVWMKKVERNPRFQFTAKLHQQFTHARILEDAEVARFKDGLRPLLKARRLGALLMQFPWAFRFTAENQEWLIRLRRAFHEFPLVAEMRHSSWLAEEAIGTFLDYRIGFCNIDQPAYTSAMPPTSYLTSGVGYVRLHGRNPNNALGGFERPAGSPASRTSGPEGSAPGERSTRLRQHDYLYAAAELDEWSRRIERVSRFAESTFVIFNNDAGGKSLVNALELEAAMQERRIVAPEELRRRYPMQLERMGPKYFQQQQLFPAA